MLTLASRYYILTVLALSLFTHVKGAGTYEEPIKTEEETIFYNCVKTSEEERMRLINLIKKSIIDGSNEHARGLVMIHPYVSLHCEESPLLLCLLDRRVSDKIAAAYALLGTMGYDKRNGLIRQQYVEGTVFEYIEAMDPDTAAYIEEEFGPIEGIRSSRPLEQCNEKKFFGDTCVIC